MVKPVIAAVNGAAVGFGASLLLPMDWRIAAEGASFAFPFARRAIGPESCASWFLPRLVGVPVALNWLMTGRRLPVEEALARGLVQEVVAPEDLVDHAVEVAQSYTEATSPFAVGLARRLAWSMLGADHPMTAHKLESRGLVAAFNGVDSEEGWKSFLEKRPPEFRSRPHADLAFAEGWWPEPPFAGAAQTPR
jgi:enoyl-CoA hydratase/carnithine racemase